MQNIYVLGSSRNATWIEGKDTNVIYPIEYANEVPKDSTPTPDLLVFTGGEDLQPEVYNKKYDFITGNKIRDEWEITWFHWAVKNKVPMFGICRGMQLFNAMSGGELIPHVENHYGTHAVFAPSFNPKEFHVNSIHHQMCIPAKGAVRVAWAKHLAHRGAKEPEALWFPEIRAFGVQWHPELMPVTSFATSFVHSKLKEYFGSMERR